MKCNLAGDINIFVKRNVLTENKQGELLSVDVCLV